MRKPIPVPVYRAGNPNVFSVILNGGDGFVVPSDTLTIKLQIRTSEAGPILATVPMSAVPDDTGRLMASLPNLQPGQIYALGLLFDYQNEPDYSIGVCTIEIKPAGYVGATVDASGFNLVIDDTNTIIDLHYETPAASVVAAYAAQVRADVELVTDMREEIGDFVSDVTSGTQAVEQARQQVESNAATVNTKAGEVATNASAVATAKSAVDTAAAAVETARGQVASNASAVATAKSAVDASAAAVETARAQVAGNASAVATAKSAVDTSAAAVESARSQVATNAGNAASAATTATSKAAEALDSANKAKTSETNSKTSETNAAASLAAMSGNIADSSVTLPKLSPEIAKLMQSMIEISGYAYVIVGANNERVFSIKTDASIEGKFIIQEVNMQPNSVNNAALKSSSVSRDKLASEVSTLLPAIYDQTGRDYAYVIADPNNSIAFAIRMDGTIQGKFDLSNSTIPLSSLPQTVRDSVPTTFDTDVSGYAYVIMGANRELVFGIKKDGTITGKLALTDGSVAESMLSVALQNKINNAQLPAPFTRLNAANAYDVEIDDDDYWRGISASIDVKTEVSGYGFARFPSTHIRTIRGINSSTTTLQFRQSLNLPIRGRRYRGTYNPTSAGLTITTYKGTYGNSFTPSYPAFSVGSVGDFWVANVSGTSSQTANGLTFKNGDLIVQTGSGTYAVQPGPGDGSFQEGDFWNVTAAGKYADVTLSTTQRLIYIGAQSASGPKFVQFILSNPGEMFLMGEVTTSSFTPVVTAQNGDLYVFGGTYTAQGVSGVEGDYLIYESVWGLIPGNVKEFAPSTYVLLEASNANRWEVRRKDKSTTPVSVTLNTYRSTVRRRANDNVVLFSDSMFGSSGLGTTIVGNLVAAGRTAAYYSYGGGTSLDILAMIKKYVRTGGDPFAGRMHVFWHGQNNQTDQVQVRNAALQLAALVGMSQKKYVFWSILGQRSASFNGTRIVCQLHEEAFAGTNHLAQIEAWYTQMFPQQWWSPRQAALASAVGRTTPDLQFPGMTEAQVATTYGILPFSYFFNYADKPFTAAQLTFAGYWSTSGLPTGGNANDYYVRTGGGTVGQIIVNVAGTWTEYVHDVTHPTAAGASVLAAAFTSYLTTNNL